MMQLSLIEPASRANDPVTSHVAASMASGMAERHREIIFEALISLRGNDRRTGEGDAPHQRADRAPTA